MMFSAQLVVILLTMSLIPEMNFSYELQDTIHNLREENAYLHHRLRNLTQALRDLRKLLLDHSNESAVAHDSDQLHAWNEWIKTGISAETHLMLEQAFCLPDIHASANSYFPEQILFLISGFIWIWCLFI